MKNPAGKGAVIPGKDMFIQNFDYRYQVLSKEKESIKNFGCAFC